MTFTMTFHSFVHNIMQNTGEIDLSNHNGRYLPYLNWVYNNLEHVSCYSMDDFLEMYMEYYDIQEDDNLAGCDHAIEMKVAEEEQAEMDKWLEIDDLNKDKVTFGYSEVMDTMSYDAW